FALQLVERLALPVVKCDIRFQAGDLAGTPALVRTVARGVRRLLLAVLVGDALIGPEDRAGFCIAVVGVVLDNGGPGGDADPDLDGVLRPCPDIAGPAR